MSLEPTLVALIVAAAALGGSWEPRFLIEPEECEQEARLPAGIVAAASCRETGEPDDRGSRRRQPVALQGWIRPTRHRAEPDEPVTPPFLTSRLTL